MHRQIYYLLVKIMEKSNASVLSHFLAPSPLSIFKNKRAVQWNSWKKLSEETFENLSHIFYVFLNISLACKNPLWI
jgi:hypothetical protein